MISEAVEHVDPDARIALVGNKADLKHLRSVTRAEAQQFAQVFLFLKMKTDFMINHTVDTLKNANVYSILFGC